jgi:hypothetical protein
MELAWQKGRRDVGCGSLPDFEKFHYLFFEE